MFIYLYVQIYKSSVGRKAPLAIFPRAVTRRRRRQILRLRWQCDKFYFILFFLKLPPPADSSCILYIICRRLFMLNK